LEESLAGSLAQDADPALNQVYVLKAEVTDLGDPGPGGEESLQDGDISNEGSVSRSGATWGRHLGLIDVLEEAPEVRQGEAARKALGLFDPDVHLAEGVDRYEVFSLQKVEEGLEGGDLALHALLGEAGEEGLDVEAKGDFVDGLEVGLGEVRRQEIGDLAQIDRVGFQGLGAEVLLVAAVEQELLDRFLQDHPVALSRYVETRMIAPGG
jgi:hypothetical protein